MTERGKDMNMTTALALDEYRSSGAHGGVEQADAHGLVNLLFNKAIDYLTSAKGYIERNQIHEKAVAIQFLKKHAFRVFFPETSSCLGILKWIYKSNYSI